MTASFAVSIDDDLIAVQMKASADAKSHLISPKN